MWWETKKKGREGLVVVWSESLTGCQLGHVRWLQYLNIAALSCFTSAEQF